MRAIVVRLLSCKFSNVRLCCKSEVSSLQKLGIANFECLVISYGILMVLVVFFMEF